MERIRKRDTKTENLRKIGKTYHTDISVINSDIDVRESLTRVFLPQPKKIDLEITGLVFQE